MDNELILLSILALPIVSMFSVYFGIVGLKSLSQWWS